MKIALEEMSRLSEERKARESKRQDMLFNKELNTAKDLLKQYREKIQAINSAVTELSTDMKTVKSDGNSDEQEKAAKLCVQTQQYVHQKCEKRA